MSKLEEFGIVDLRWSEKDGNVYATGLQDYIIFPDGEVATFLNSQHVKSVQAIDMWHAVGMVYAGESVARWNLRNGKPRSAYQRGGNIDPQINELERDLFAAFDAFKKGSDCVDCGVTPEENFAEGMAHALGIMRSTDADTEWNSIEEKWNSVYAKPSE